MHLSLLFMTETITSPHNPLIKKVKRLQDKSAERREAQLFVAEGVRECSLMQQTGYELDTLLVCEAIYKPSAVYPVALTGNIRWVNKEVYESMAYRDSTEGIIALARPKAHRIAELSLGKTPLILVLVGVEKPGNIGAMLRTCDAAAVDAVIICDAKADVYNPNVIRSSLGTVFTNPVAVCSWQEAKAFFVQHHITCFAAMLGASKPHYRCNFNQPTAFVLGTEATGLPHEVLRDCDEQLIIPMLGKIDSLNVSVSAAVLLYEAVRQKMTKPQAEIS